MNVPAPLPVSVVIVNYNAGPLLHDAVASVLGTVAEVVVVDNASHDDSLAPLRALVAAGTESSGTRLRVIEAGRNLGFAAACNMGARDAHQPFLLFLNPDGRPAPGAIARLLEVLRTHPRAGMAGGLLQNPDGTEQGGGRRRLPTPGRALARALGLTHLSSRVPDFHLHRQPLPAGPAPVEAISGACMLVRREAMAQVGPWDEGYFLHCEDLDWCLRFQRGGWDILFVPDAPVVHHQGACSRSRPYFVEWHKHRGMLRFYRKFFRDRYPGPLMLLVAAGVWTRFGAVAARQALRDLSGRRAHG